VTQGVARLERRTQQTCVSANRQCALVASVVATRQHCETAVAARRLGKRLRIPVRFATHGARPQPDLEQLERYVALVEFSVTNAGPGAHHLHVASADRALRAQRVAVPKHALPDVSNDLDVTMAVKRKAAVHRDFVVVPNHQRTECRVFWIPRGANLKVILRSQPAVVGLIERFPTPVS
jgi:hypothetical protein